MKKLKNKLDGDLFVNYIVNKIRDYNMNQNLREKEVDLDTLQNREFFNYDMYLD